MRRCASQGTYALKYRQRLQRGRSRPTRYQGSRLLLTVNANKNAFAEINYGTGKDVAAESIKDAGAPMRVDWLTTSYIRLSLSTSAS
jgi:hypothetical protein